jgi:uncharacterized membrane protein YukC
MARPKTIFNPLSVKNRQIEQVEKVLSSEKPAESTYFSSDLASSLLSVHSDVDISEDLKAEPTKTIAELLSPNIDTLPTQTSESEESPKSKKKTKNKSKNPQEVIDEEKADSEQEDKETSDSSN